MKAAVKGHLDDLGKEIGSLIENSKPGSGAVLASWTKNSDDIDVALKVIGAVSYYVHQKVLMLLLSRAVLASVCPLQYHQSVVVPCSLLVWGGVGGCCSVRWLAERATE